MANNDNKPIGARIRDLINPALADTRKDSTQLEILDRVFMTMASRLDGAFEGEFQQIFNDAALVERRNPDQKNIFLIQQLTKTDMRGEPLYSPSITMRVPIITTFAEFLAMDVCQLPGYIALHEKAREMDVAVRINGLTPEESKSGGGQTMPVLLTLDASKTYLEGAGENAKFYPQLPPVKVEYDRKASGDFNLR